MLHAVHRQLFRLLGQVVVAILPEAIVPDVVSAHLHQVVVIAVHLWVHAQARAVLIAVVVQAVLEVVVLPALAALAQVAIALGAQEPHLARPASLVIPDEVVEVQVEDNS